MTTKKEVDDLKAAADGLESEKRQLETRINEAYGRYLTAKRDFQRNERLTPAMIVALKALVEPNAHAVDFDPISRSGRHSYYVKDASGNNVCDMVHSVFYGLRSREVIDGGKRDGVYETLYQITEHGREILNQRIQTKKAA